MTWKKLATLNGASATFRNGKSIFEEPKILLRASHAMP